MKIINLIWGFYLGAGIDKCYLTYAQMNSEDSQTEMLNVCIYMLDTHPDLKLLQSVHTHLIEIKGQKDFSWVKKLKTLIDTEKPDVFFTHGFNGAVAAYIMRKLKGIKLPLICSYHGLYHAPSAKKKIMEPIYNGLSRYVYKKYANSIICVENFSRNFLIEKGIPKNKVFTVHNGLPDLLDTGSQTAPFVRSTNECHIITASRITEVKGLTYLLEALALLKQKDIPFHYHMIGEGPDLVMLKQQCKQLNLDDCVSFEGYQTNIADWLQASDIFALPSLHEYHSIAVLEAMRAGKPMVVTNVGGNTESVTDGIEAKVVPAKDPSTFSQALMDLIAHPDLAKRLGKAARERFLKEFTETAMKRKILGIIKNSR